MRTVICHYHIYKNSGTSFDTLLTENFKDTHICFDGPFPFFTIDQEQLSRIVERKKNIIAFSSHQIQLPTPASLDFEVLSAVFIRHPLLRIQSIYRFKRQTYDGTTTSKAAMEKSFDDWLDYCFSDRQEITHISNAQTRILGSTYCQKPLIRRKPQFMEYNIWQAVKNIEGVSLLGRTEYFGEDVIRFSRILKTHGIEFNAENSQPKNVTSGDHGDPLEQRIEKLLSSITIENRQRLLAANTQDIQLFDHANEIINHG